MRVFIENKFWAALTENQPLPYLPYLQQLQQQSQPALLLLVVPRTRVPWIWREFLARLATGGSRRTVVARLAASSSALVPPMITSLGSFAEVAWSDVSEPRSAGIHEGPLVAGV